jgi:membrane peptidoglycan carboxypeptidase
VAQRLGIASPLQANASLALGTSEVTPLEMTAAYAAFANGGQGVTPYIIREVKAANGKVLYKREGSGIGTVIDGARLPMMNGMMRETLLTGTGRKAEIPGWEAGGKTGTTQDFRDAWFVGYTSRLVASVWLGNDDNSPMKRVSGGGLPSSGWPRPSMMRPSKSGPRHTCEVWLITLTLAPGPMPCGSVKGSKNRVSSLKPTTSASTRWPICPITSQHAPNGAIRPRVSKRMPTNRTKVPLRWGSGACSPPISWLTSCSKFMRACPRRVRQRLWI